MIDGVRYRGSTKENTVGKARQFESILMTKIREGGLNRQMRKAPLLSEVAKKFLEEVDAATKAGNLAPKTKEHYHHGWKLLP
jgi:hypothetical protein